MKKLLLLAFGLFLSQSNAQILLEEGFEGATFPPTGWTTFIGTNGLGPTQNWKLETQSVNSGAKAAYVQYQNVTGGLAEDWMVTSQIDLATASQAELSFFTRKLFANQTSNKSTYYIKVSTTSQTDRSTFTDVQVWTEEQLTAVYNVYEKKIVDLSAFAVQKVYIAFVMTNDNGNSWFVDDVKLSAQSSEAPAANLPYQYGFEAEDGWKTENVGSGNTWTIEETNSFYAASEGTKHARYRFSSSNPANAWYISRGINLVKDKPVKIEFDYNTGGFGGVEKMKLAIGKGKTASTFTTTLWENTELTNTTWETATVEFTPTEDGVYYLGFHAYSDPDQMYLFLDNVNVSEVETLATSNLVKDDFKFYPNPIKDKLYLKNNSEISKISIYSIDGRLVSEKNINSKEAEVAMPNVAAGSYIGVVKLSNGKTKSIKLIKK